jgi:hypothetical protein
MENCTFSEYPTILAKLKLLANISIYWPKSRLANESEQLLDERGSRIDYGRNPL